MFCFVVEQAPILRRTNTGDSLNYDLGKLRDNLQKISANKNATILMQEHHLQQARTPAGEFHESSPRKEEILSRWAAEAHSRQEAHTVAAVAPKTLQKKAAGSLTPTAKKSMTKRKNNTRSGSGSQNSMAATTMASTTSIVASTSTDHKSAVRSKKASRQRRSGAESSEFTAVLPGNDKTDFLPAGCDTTKRSSKIGGGGGTCSSSTTKRSCDPNTTKRSSTGSRSQKRSAIEGLAKLKKDLQKELQQCITYSSSLILLKLGFFFLSRAVFDDLMV